MGKKMKNANKGKTEGGAVRSETGNDMLAESTRAGFGLTKTNPSNRKDT